MEELIFKSGSDRYLNPMLFIKTHLLYNKSVTNMYIFLQNFILADSLRFLLGLALLKALRGGKTYKNTDNFINLRTNFTTKYRPPKSFS